MTDFTPFTPGDYGQPQFLFTEPVSGYRPAIAWAARQKGQPVRRRRRSRQWGAWLRRCHFARLAERSNALARLSTTAEAQGWIAASASKRQEGA